ncbi:MAG: intradiol ring-cleavage dioxygenase, partial [Cyclobacteriaceae bacterium]|nr:intradiol ring-cleavage dioxygenase [Cyclobacteriaceae bacterium]
MKSLILLFFLLLSLTSVAQRDSSKKIGGGCDGCELMYVGIPQVINAVDTSAGWHEPGTRLIVTGKVYQRDGRTPAPGVIVYYWQTDSKGLYSS